MNITINPDVVELAKKIELIENDKNEYPLIVWYYSEFGNSAIGQATNANGHTYRHFQIYQLPFGKPPTALYKDFINDDYQTYEV